MRESKKYQERMFFNEFVRLWENYPNDAIIEKREKRPDFIISSKKFGKIGVEVTQLINRKKENEKYSVTQRFGLENKLVNNTRELYCEQCFVPIEVRLSFINNLYIKQKDISNFAQNLCEIIIREVEEFDLSQINRVSLKEGLPRQLISMSITFYPKLSQTLWYPNQSAILPNIYNNDIKIRVQKKELLIHKYKLKVNEIYLLIVEGIPPISWFNKFENWQFENFVSDFDKVFLLRRRHKKLYELK